MTTFDTLDWMVVSTCLIALPGLVLWVISKKYINAHVTVDGRSLPRSWFYQSSSEF